MKIKLLILIFVGLTIESFGQNLRVGFGFVNQMSFSNSVVQLDSVKVFENRQQQSFDLMPYFKLEWPITERFNSNLGVQFYKSAVFLTTNYRSDFFPETIPSISKGWSTPIYNLEFPIGLSYTLVKKKQFRVFLEFSAVPVWSIQNFTPFDIDVPQGIDWTQEILDVINAVETIPNPFYMNYQYGISMEYKRFGLTLFRSENMSRSISTDYHLYEKSYNFQRRIQSTRFGIYYSLELKKEKN
ncbi:MAG: hypothetical protein ACK4SF_06815 [Algoriphagus aquaeductus]|uniref:hypothetical protein n=1 Tax=Algoriphagus aquaeductus TaxID=475299 RepID=UPI00391D33DF